MSAHWHDWQKILWRFASLALSLATLSAGGISLAQIIPDNTLRTENSVVVPINGQDALIQGGAIRRSGLFHSFRAFNIGEGRGVYFANPVAVENVFSRVTGNNPSHLFGTLGVLGKANLFFLNPNGILFGPNFNLDVRGSFVATTANSIAFPDGNLFSATDPQAPPLLTVNVTAPIGLRFEGATPGSIVNAGNLTVDEGQNLTLAAGTIASTGLLAAPGGEVAVVSVPGASPDGIPTVQLAAGQFLGLAIEPLDGPETPTAPAGLSLPELLAGTTTTGLTVNAGEVGLTASELAVEAGDATVNQLSAGAATLSAAGNLTLVDSQLSTTGNLQLLAKDTVRVRDSVAHPFIAAAGGELLVQGNQGVDIFALNHANSGLFSGGDMTLRSAETVSGDAHYWSGGNFRIEQLDGSLGNLSSPNDPIIRANSDVLFTSYTGSSLHILAGGNVIVLGDIDITSTDVINFLKEDITLSDGTTSISIDGSAEPTVDIRAGVDWTLLGGPPGNTVDGAGSRTPIFNPRQPDSAVIFIGDHIKVDPIGSAGVNVFLTNQYKPNTALAPSSAIYVRRIRSGDALGGGKITIDSRGDLILNGVIFASPIGGSAEGGDITLLADGDITLKRRSQIHSSGLLMGDITLKSKANISLERNFIGGSSRAANSNTPVGKIKLIADAIALDDSTVVESSSIGQGRGADIELEANSIFLVKSVVDTSTNGQGKGGDIALKANDLILLDSRIEAITEGTGEGGNLTADVADSVTLIASVLRTETEGSGNAGDLTLRANRLLARDRSKISTRTVDEGIGGDLKIDAAQILVRDGSQIETGTFGNSTSAGAAGNLTVNASDLIEASGFSIDQDFNVFPSGFLTPSDSAGRGGKLTINTRQLLIRDGAAISASGDGTGDAGNVKVHALDSVQVIGSALYGLLGVSGIFSQAQGLGNSGNLTIDTRKLSVQDGGAISTTTFGPGDAGKLIVNASDSVDLHGSALFGFLPSLLSTQADRGSTGNGGNLIINTQQLQVWDGGRVLARTLGAGIGGNLTINTKHLIATDRAAISSSTLSTGTGRNLTINVERLTIRGGAQISAGAFDAGHAGRLTINASDVVEVTGISATNSAYPSGVFTGSQATGHGGKLTINTRQLLIRDGAAVSASAESAGNAGDLTVSASDVVKVSGNGSSRVSRLSSQAEGSGNAGNLTINTRELLVEDGGGISTTTLGAGNAGKLTINASDLVQLNGSAAFGLQPSVISAQTDKDSTGNAGDLTITTKQLQALDGGQVLAGTLGTGKGSDLTVNALELIELTGVTSDGLSASALSVQAGSTATGSAGNLTVNTERLIVRDGAQISSGTLGQGNGGNLAVNASDSILLIGTAPDDFAPSGFIASALGTLGRDHIGNAGSITINTKRLEARDGAQVTAETVSGKGGSIILNASESIHLTGISDNGFFPSGVLTGTFGSGNAGSTTITSNNVTVTDRAEISAVTLSSGNAGNINVRARQAVSLANRGMISSAAILNGAGDGGTGDGGTIDVQAPLLHLSDEARILTSSHGQSSADAGDINLRAEEVRLQTRSQVSATTAAGLGGKVTVNANRLHLSGASRVLAETEAASRAGTVLLQPGSGPDLTIDVQDGSQISVSTTSNGAGGDLNIKASETIIIRGNGLLSAETSGIGNAGRVAIETGKLRIEDGASVSASTASHHVSGTAGGITVNAARSVTLSNQANLLAQSTGAATAGSLRIRTGQLTVKNRSQAAVSSQGTSDAGNLEVAAANILLDDQSRLIAETASGKGGNIRLDVEDALVMRRNSQISTTAGTAQAGGDGGNITIDAGFVVAVPGENSDIFANAFTGRGGNINITANGIFGLKFRPFLTEFSDITASSQFGVDGTVQLNTLGIDPSRGLGLLPEEPTTLQVAASCQTRGSEAAVEFFDVGSGGLPPRPDEPLGNAIVIADLIPLDEGIEAQTDSAVRETFISPFSIDASEGVDAATRWVFCQQAAASL